ncbi:MAG: hypothetical protein QW265_05105 [Candidatus Bathyarchaeia archaeon]
MRRVCVIGLGTVGLPTAIYIKRHGFETWGYDLKPISSKFFKTTEWDSIPKSIDAYVICVSTGLDASGNIDIRNVYEACEKISKSNQSALISIESTVPVGTCKDIAERFEFAYVVHCPHRFWSESPRKHGVKQLRVLGAINDKALKKGLEFYRKLKIPVHVVPKIEIAELCKIAENAHRFVQIAFAEELKMLCDSLGLDFEEVREACNTKWNVDILEAREGIGGECLPKDTRYFRLMAKSANLVDGALRADELYKKMIRDGD